MEKFTEEGIDAMDVRRVLGEILESEPIIGMPIDSVSNDLKEWAATVCLKVNLSDVFFVARPNENWAYRNKIDRKHVDFLLCEPTMMKPLARVELDDSSHRRPDRQARDDFVDQVFDAAGLPLLRIPAKSGYNAESLAAQLSPCLGRSPVAQHSVATAAIDAQPCGSPVCPKCGVPMVQRTASKGSNKGQQFWGCRNFPKCREVIV